MKLINNTKLVLKGFWSRKSRSFLTILGIVIGVAGVIIIISLGAGAQKLVLGQVTKLGSNLIGILPGKSNENGPPSSVFGVEIKTLTNDDAEALANKDKFPYIEGVAAYVRGQATVVYGNKSIDTNFTGTTASYPLVQNVDMEEGSFFSPDQAQAGANVVVLGSDVKAELFDGRDPVGQIVKIKSVPFRVLGVVKKQGTVFFQNQDDQVFIPLTIGQHQLIGINYLQYIRIKVDKEEHIQATVSDIEGELRARHRIKRVEDDDFSVRDMADAISMLTGITDALRIFLGVMAGIALLVGGIGIMNIMLVTVKERTREIGLRKAIGATTENIRDQFLLEAIVLTLGGGIIGIIFGSLISFLISLGAKAAGFDWSFIISPTAIILGLSVSVLTGIIFGFYPAYKASKLDPIVALRYE